MAMKFQNLHGSCMKQNIYTTMYLLKLENNWKLEFLAVIFKSSTTNGKTRNNERSNLTKSGDCE